MELTTVSSEASRGKEDFSELLIDAGLWSVSLTVANAAAAEETEGLDLLPAESRASAPLPVDAEEELAEEECLRPSLISFGDGNAVRSSESSHAADSSVGAMPLSLGMRSVEQ